MLGRSTFGRTVHASPLLQSLENRNLPHRHGLPLPHTQLLKIRLCPPLRHVSILSHPSAPCSSVDCSLNSHRQKGSENWKSGRLPPDACLVEPNPSHPPKHRGHASGLSRPQTIQIGPSPGAEGTKAIARPPRSEKRPCHICTCVQMSGALRQESPLCPAGARKVFVAKQGTGCTEA